MRVYEADRLAVPAVKLGEGPCWDSSNRTLIYVDITASTLHRYSPDTGSHSCAPLGQLVGAAVPFSNKVAVALTSGIYLFNDNNPKDPYVESFLCRPKSMSFRERFNDGKLDPTGRFVVGTMALSGSSPIGHLYSVEEDGAVTELLDGVQISNGLDWTADGKTMYYIDTLTRAVSVFDYNVETGEISGRRIAFEVPPERGHPDGMCIDAAGMLWVAHWGGGMIGRYDPKTGELLAKIMLPEKNTTSCCFGESETGLFITTADDESAGIETAAKGGLYYVEIEL